MLGPHKMKMSHYFISLWYSLELGTFLISEDPPHNFELSPTETWDFFDFLTTPFPIMKFHLFHGFNIKRLMYITDWFGTLMHVAGLEKMIPTHLDTYNMWPSISYGKKSPRTEIILNLDQDTFWDTWSAAIRVGKYKYIWGQRYLLKQKVRLPYS